jgi:hypothetical protein
VFEFIEVFYNRTRRHSSLGYISPDAFEAAYLRSLAALPTSSLSILITGNPPARPCSTR